MAEAYEKDTVKFKPGKTLRGVKMPKRSGVEWECLCGLHVQGYDECPFCNRPRRDGKCGR